MPVNRMTMERMTMSIESSFASNASPSKMCLFVKWLKTGNESVVSRIASIKEITHNMADSERNCIMIRERLPPVIFLMPTSLALFKELAILILIKLMLAIKRIKTAIAIKR